MAKARIGSSERGLIRASRRELMHKASTWLNPIEPHWLHCKRAVYSVDEIPTLKEIRYAVDDYFDIRNAWNERKAMNS